MTDKRPPGRPPVYPWAKWFASADPVHVACRGKDEDWDIAPRSFQMQAIRQAKERNLRISTRKCRQHEDCIILHHARRPKMNWDVLCNGQSHWITYESIRPTMPESFANLARTNARKRGLSLRIDRTQVDTAMLITAVPKIINTSMRAGEQARAKYGQGDLA